VPKSYLRHSPARSDQGESNSPSTVWSCLAPCLTVLQRGGVLLRNWVRRRLVITEKRREGEVCGVNLLLSMLQARAEVLPDIGHLEELSFDWLADIAEAEAESLGSLLRAARADSLISSELNSAFAGVVPLAEWEQAREEGVAEQAEIGAYGEWVEMTLLPGRDYGITLPEDRQREPRISLFTRVDGAVRRLSVVALPGRRPTLELRLAGGECGSPYRGRCSGGSCSECAQEWIDRGGAPPAYHCFCVGSEDGLVDADAGEAGVGAQVREASFSAYEGLPVEAKPEPA
jgi:hypothetical protein